MIITRIFYTDGSCVPNPGKGGWAVIENNKPVALGTEEYQDPTLTTNIRMECQAIIAALRIAKGSQCTIYTDSEFWCNVVTKWAEGWEKRGWKKATKGEIQNLDLVKEAYTLYKASNATLSWVRGHNKLEGNELADMWANKAREGVRL